MKGLKAFIFLLLLMAGTAHAAAPGSVSQKLDRVTGGDMLVLTFSWVGSPDDGTVPATAASAAIIERIAGHYITEVRTNPGDTSPTAAYDITLTDSDGIDVMGGTLADRSATASERAIPALATGIYGATLVCDTLTFTLTNNAVHSATGTVKVFLSR